ncbi:hypothetical protein K1T71_011726 [Dendrolimus kikuchii]|uniref:Uncharacterized protein n=1 Tax=Dendrolimus kikuchii TaxID=765133 RepID=A0ACC1CM82_9NEOP|nr:hypothetical protein K1T71_011726 [Dendrolimus kikuchii]
MNEENVSFAWIGGRKKLLLSTTSTKPKMRRISHNNPVRRRLFPEADLTEQASIDNFANILKETIANDRKRSMEKWNFDFENEVPLEGNIEWFRSDGEHDWIGIKAETKLLDDEELIAQNLNESTPKSVKEDSVLLVRKRRKDYGIVSDKARRKVNFD